MEEEELQLRGNLRQRQCLETWTIPVSNHITLGFLFFMGMNWWRWKESVKFFTGTWEWRLTSLPCYCSKGMATQSLCGFPVLLWLFLCACPRNFFLVSPGLVLTEMNHALCTLHILRQNISWKCNHSLVTAWIRSTQAHTLLGGWCWFVCCIYTGC